MKRIKIFGDEYEAEQITCKDNEIIGRTGGHNVFRFSRVLDMSRVELLDNAEWDEPELTVEEQLALLKKENELLKKRLDGSEDGLLSLMDITVMGGM